MRRVRKIVVIDEEKCDGCGLCVPSCAEGAIQIIDGKARLVSDIYCDGLGACLGKCPRDAISIEERDAENFDKKAAKKHVQQLSEKEGLTLPASGVCPGALSRMWDNRPAAGKTAADRPSTPSALGNWPVQLNLVPLKAPYFDGADLLIAADCVPFAFEGFHARLLEGKTLLIGCPKLDDAEHYLEKLTQIFLQNDIRSVEVAIMEVPCCSGLTRLVLSALNGAGKFIPATSVRISITGEVLDSMEL
ncbi:MAG: 4Fe-4S binding protein [Gemmatimonadota bacterium]|nr:4Fe-4S binding protein [Gemmatimonadota bacterium]